MKASCSSLIFSSSQYANPTALQTTPLFDTPILHRPPSLSPNHHHHIFLLPRIHRIPRLTFFRKAAAAAQTRQNPLAHRSANAVPETTSNKQQQQQQCQRPSLLLWPKTRTSPPASAPPPAKPSPKPAPLPKPSGSTARSKPCSSASPPPPPTSQPARHSGPFE